MQVFRLEFLLLMQLCIHCLLSFPMTDFHRRIYSIKFIRRQYRSGFTPDSLFTLQGCKFLYVTHKDDTLNDLFNFIYKFKHCFYTVFKNILYQTNCFDNLIIKRLILKIGITPGNFIHNLNAFCYLTECGILSVKVR